MLTQKYVTCAIVFKLVTSVLVVNEKNALKRKNKILVN